MADKTVRIGVNSEQVEQYSSKIRDISKEYFNQIVRDYRSAEVHSNKIISNLREEINLQKEKNRLRLEGQRFQLEELKEKGQISEQGYKTRAGALDKAGASEDRQTKIMKDILEATIMQTRELVKSDRDSAEKFVRSTERKMRGGGEVSEEEFLRYGVSKELLQSRKAGGGFISMGGGGIPNIGGAIRGAGAGDVAEVAGLGLRLLPQSKWIRAAMVALGVGAAGASVVGSLDEELTKFSVATQNPLSRVRANLSDLAPNSRVAALGLTQAQYLNYQVSAIQGMGGGNPLSPAYGLAMAGAGVSRGMDPAMMGRTFESFRYSNRSVDPLSLFATLEKFLKDTGQPLSRLPEVLNTYLDASQSIVSRTGSVNALNLEQTLLSLSRSYDVSGVNLGRYSQGFERMGTRSQNPLMQAMQYQTLARIYPEKDLFELQTIMESPLEHPEYLQSLLKDVSKYGGGKGTMMSKFALKAATGMSGKDIENIIKKDYQSYFPNKDDQETKAILNSYPKQGEEMIGGVKELSKNLTNGVQTIISKISDIIDGSAGMQEAIEGINLANPENKKVLKDAFREALDSSQKMDIISKKNRGM